MTAPSSPRARNPDPPLTHPPPPFPAPRPRGPVAQVRVQQMASKLASHNWQLLYAGVAAVMACRCDEMRSALARSSALALATAEASAATSQGASCSSRSAEWGVPVGRRGRAAQAQAEAGGGRGVPAGGPGRGAQQQRGGSRPSGFAGAFAELLRQGDVAGALALSEASRCASDGAATGGQRLQAQVRTHAHGRVLGRCKRVCVWGGGSAGGGRGCQDREVIQEVIGHCMRKIGR